jgi:hypothetical protein
LIDRSEPELGDDIGCVVAVSNGCTREGDSQGWWVSEQLHRRFGEDDWDIDARVGDYFFELISKEPRE